MKAFLHGLFVAVVTAVSGMVIALIQSGTISVASLKAIALAALSAAVAYTIKLLTIGSSQS